MAMKVRLDEAAAVPGGSTSCNLAVRNSGLDRDVYRFEVRGEASTWARVSPPILELLPDAEGTVKVFFDMPRSPWPAAGALPVDVRVVSQAEPNRPALATSLLRIEPFSEAHATLEPRLSRGRRRAQHVVTVHNRGNTPLRARIAPAMADRGLQVDVEPQEVNVAPGRCGAARVTARCPLPSLWRPGSTRRFELQVGAGGVGPLVLGAEMQREPAGLVAKVIAAASLFLVAGLTLTALALAH
jgi:hypothetical protein